jgi:hypothetical protein
MMAAVTHLHVRDARDRLVELLGLGQPYPLRDLAVHDEQLTVAFNTPAKIPIADSQPGVLYQLYFRQAPVSRTETGEQGAGAPIQAWGSGGLILLESYKIREDITFDILATKQFSGRAAYLHQTATVKVGLDVSLRAWIRDAPLLEPALENPTDEAARLVHYGTTVEVEIANSQEGVDYRLVYFKEAASGTAPQEVKLSVADVRGNLGNILLRSQPVKEDIDIRIRAVKTFDPSEGRARQTTLLEATLPLKVRANPDLSVSVAPASIIGFKETATVKIAATQPSAAYRLYIRPIPDRDFVRQTVVGAEVIKVSLAGEPDIQVRRPARTAVWALPAGYTEVGEAQQGNGGTLSFPIEALAGDSLIIVKAEKMHQPTPAAETAPAVPSAVQLAQAVVVLTQPDPAPPLRLKVWLPGGVETNGVVEVSGGQPGVFYYFRRDPEGDDLGRPAYFHQREGDENKGLGEQLTLGVDFVVARPLPPAATGSLARVSPAPPLLETGPIPVGAGLAIRAVKAQTRLAAPLSQTAQIPAGPAVEPEKEVVDYGASTNIRVKASQARETYQLWLAGQPLGEPVKGTGQNRLLPTGPLTEGAAFELLMTPLDGPIWLERVQFVPVLVRPNPALPASAAVTPVDPNTATEIRVEASQPGVSYQLLAAGTPLGQPVAGTGATIVLPTGPLNEETTFTIRAFKPDRLDIMVELAQQVTVQVRQGGEG